MSRYVAKGIITGLLISTVVYLFKTAGADCLFIVQHFIEIIAGEAELPAIKNTTVVCLFVIPSLLALLIGTIPRKNGSYIDEEDDDK